MKEKTRACEICGKPATEDRYAMDLCEACGVAVGGFVARRVDSFAYAQTLASEYVYEHKAICEACGTSIKGNIWHISGVIQEEAGIRSCDDEFEYEGACFCSLRCGKLYIQRFLQRGENE